MLGFCDVHFLHAEPDSPSFGDDSMTFGFLTAVVSRFLRQGCTSLAASLAFFTLLSLFPMVFLLLYAVSFLVSQEIIGQQFLLSFLKGFLPTLGQGLGEEIRRVGALESARWIVLLTFAWFGTLVFYELEYAINTVFGTPSQRHPLISTAISTVVAVTLFGALELLLILSYVMTQIIDMLVTHAPHLWGLDLVALAAYPFLLTYTLPFTLALVTVTSLYRYLPRQRPSWRNALIGGLVFGILWVLAKHFFGAYGQQLSVYSRLYGSLLEVVLLLLWVYYSAGLLLFGAVIVRQLQLRTHPVSSP
ncbi:MAG: YihY/virulence factor BrkB family protein [Nitrospiraceae bacterium]